MKKLILIDGNSLLFRAYYATAYGKAMETSQGVPTNALFALFNMMKKILDSNTFDYAIVAFDTSKPTFRHIQYEQYKGTRSKAPDNLVAQFMPARQLLTYLGFFIYEKDGYEADDIIGTLAKLATSNNISVDIYSSDRDLLQLINDNVSLFLPKTGTSDLAKMTPEVLFNDLGITPSQITDLKGLMGDASDNIPGIAGIGKVTALKLLTQYQTLEEILKADLKGKLKENIDTYAKDGLMSKDLATIYCDIPFEYQFNDIKYNGLLLEDLKSFLNQYEMYSLLTKLPTAKIFDEQIEETVIDMKYQIVERFKVEMLKKAMGLYIEFTSDNPYSSQIIGFALSDLENNYFISYDNAIKDEVFLAYLADESNKKYVYDLKKYLTGISFKSLCIKGLDFDLLLASYLIDSSFNDNISEVLSYFEVNAIDLNQVRKSLDKKIEDPNLDSKVINCYISYAYNIIKIKDQVIAKLQQIENYDLYINVELPLTYILAKMELQGVKLDVEELAKQEKIITIKQNKIEEEIISLAGKDFNINSPIQLAQVLFDDLGLKANKKRSTAVEYLQAIYDSHPIIEKILLHRKYAKLLSNYLVGLNSYLYEDGKLHSIFNQALTLTGRLSSKDPNLQNISNRDQESKLVRKAFIPSKQENYLLSFDYSQIELRVLASLANADSLIQAFANDIDIHVKTASEVFKVPINEVTNEMRQKAKAVNFGIIYGISDFGLKEQIGVSNKEASEYIKQYFESFKEIKEYLDNAVSECKNNGYVKTILNRIRYVPQINDANYMTREFGKRIAMNSPIQGSAADIIKLAMIKVDEVLRKNNFKTVMIMQIHDELVFEVPYEELLDVVPLIKLAMESAVDLKVKMKVEYEYGPSWYEC